VAFRRGRNADQDLGMARPGIEYFIGRTSIKADYNFEYESHLGNEERFRHLVFIRADRRF